MSSKRWTSGLAAAVVMTTAGWAAAEPPDPEWIARKDHAVVVETQDGSLVTGKLVGVEEGGVEVLTPDGARTVVDRAAIKALRTKLRDQQVTVTMKEDDTTFSGKLAESDAKTIVLVTDSGRRLTLDRGSIKSVRDRFAEAPAAAPSGEVGAYHASEAKDASPEASPPEPTGVPARTGFQMALSTGYSLRFGSADGSTSQSDFVSNQVPLLVEIGAKSGRYLFFGAYLGFGFGGAGDALSGTCATPGVSCSSLSVRFGGEVQVHILPSARFNPYLGYGVGLEYASVSGSSSTGSASLSAVGFERGRFTLGADYRLNHYIGFGPYVTIAVAQYLSESEDAGSSSMSGDVADKALHEWLTVGGRFTLFP